VLNACISIRAGQMLFIYLIIHMKKLHVEATLKSSTIIGRYCLRNQVELAEFLCHVPQKSVSQRFVVELAKSTYIMSYLQRLQPYYCNFKPWSLEYVKEFGWMGCGWCASDLASGDSHSVQAILWVSWVGAQDECFKWEGRRGPHDKVVVAGEDNGWWSGRCCMSR